MSQCTFEPKKISSTKKCNPNLEKNWVERLSKSPKSPKNEGLKKVDRIKYEDLIECTHNPKIGKAPLYLQRNVSEIPKQYYEAVSRIQKVNEEKLKKAAEEQKIISERSNRIQKLKRMKSNPPSLLSREPCAKREIVVFVDATVFPGK